MDSTLTIRPEAVSLLDYWHAQRDGGNIPHRRSISPKVLRQWLGNVSVIHLHDGPKRFYVSLHGANVARHIGPDFNKEYLEDAVPPGSLSMALAPYLDCIEHRMPTYSIMLPSFVNGLHSTLERMVLPFSGDDPEKIERFLVWVAPNDRSSDAKGSIYTDGSESMVLFRLGSGGHQRVTDGNWESGDASSEGFAQWRRRRQIETSGF